MAADRNFALQSMSRNIIACGAKRKIKRSTCHFFKHEASSSDDDFCGQAFTPHMFRLLVDSEKASDARSQRLASEILHLGRAGRRAVYLGVSANLKSRTENA